MAVDLGSLLGDECYVRPGQMQDLIREKLLAELDKLTTK